MCGNSWLFHGLADPCFVAYRIFEIQVALYCSVFVNLMSID